MKAGFPEVFGLLVVIGSAYLMFGRSAPLGASDITFLLVILSITYFVLRSSEARGKSHRN
jgi:hypothetical protein